MPAVTEVERKLAAALERAGFAGTETTLVVGVSGGADSSTLLYGLNNLRERCGIRLHVAHLNHDFRGEEADEDARFVESLARELGLPFSVEKRDPIAYQRERRISSFEQGAREMRYEFLARIAREAGAAAVAVGHTSDDLAETVLLHILRGSGLPGLRGMTETAPWPWPVGLATPTLFRPLLEVTKAQTVEYCTERGREYRQDSGNSLFRFTRNRVRQELLPWLAAEFNPRVGDALVRLAHTSSQELEYLEAQLDREWGELTAPETVAGSQGPAGSDSYQPLALDRPGLRQLHPALRRMALRRAYTEVRGDPRRLRENHLQAMSDLAAGPRSEGSLHLPGGLLFQVTRERVLLAAAAEHTLDESDASSYPELAGPHTIEVPKADAPPKVLRVGEWQVTLAPVSGLTVPNPESFLGDRAVLALEDWERTITLRNREPGDRFQPMGMAGTKKLKDFFGDAKTPRQWRDKVPLAVTERGIAWVVGYRIAEWARVPDGYPPDAPLLAVTFESSVPG